MSHYSSKSYNVSKSYILKRILRDAIPTCCNDMYIAVKKRIEYNLNFFSIDIGTLPFMIRTDVCANF